MTLRAWVISAGLVLAALPANAQEFRARSELVTSSGYLWRGITRHRSAVAQLFGAAGVATRTVGIELSTWASGIGGDCNRATCPEGTGLRVADVNASLLGSFLWKGTWIALGTNMYHFDPAPYSPGASATTWEAVASLHASPTRHVQFALTAWMDVDDVDGLYAEATGTMPLTLTKAKPPALFFTATLGRNQGQNTTADGHPALGYFARNGFTHISLEAEYLLHRPDSAGKGTTVELFVRLQGNFDPGTKASVWPFSPVAAEQQIVAGVVLAPLVSYHADRRKPW